MNTQVVILKTYIEIAFECQAYEKDIDIATWADSVHAMARVLRKVEPDFNKAQFLNNCGWRLVFGVDAQ